MDKIVLLLVILAITFQILGCIASTIYDGKYDLSFLSPKISITSEHLWWDSLFLLELAIIFAIYSTK